jgi:hypothetical protein
MGVLCAGLVPSFDARMIVGTLKAVAANKLDRHASHIALRHEG